MQFDERTVRRMRAALEETAQAANPTQATQAKMAERVVRRAAEGNASREQLRDAAIEESKEPAD